MLESCKWFKSEPFTLENYVHLYTIPYSFGGSSCTSKTIVIVEDNDLNIKLFNNLLEAHGYVTLQTKDGREVIDLAPKQRPDLILMNIQLPEISGLEITKMLKADDDLKIISPIAETAFAMKVDK